MDESSDIPRAKKNLRALLTLGFVLALVASLGGGLLLALGYFRAPNVMQPLWQFGQYVLFLGLANLFVYLGLFFCVRKVFTALGGHSENVKA